MVLTRDSPLRLRFAADPSAAALLRERLALWLDELGAGDEEVFEISLACSEAFANAVQHPFEPAAGLIDIYAVSDKGTVTVVVRDYGTWAGYSTDENGGRGLPLMQELMDSVQVDASLDGTSIAMQRRLEVRSPPAARWG